MKQEKQALRKSPERKVGQVLLAPYRLPQKLFREVRKQMRARRRCIAAIGFGPRNIKPGWSGIASLRNRRALREEAREFVAQPLISIITPVFNTPVSWLEEAVDSVLATRRIKNGNCF